MFTDYYEVLGLDFGVDCNEIHKSYKKQAFYWHPDKNKSEFATVKMQEINEAYLILKDKEAKARYDAEYKKYKTYIEKLNQAYSKDKNQGSQEANNFEKDYFENKKGEKKAKEYYEEYHISDDILKKWIDNAKRQAKELAKFTLDNTIGLAKETSKAVVNGVIGTIILVIIINIIYFIIHTLSNS